MLPAALLAMLVNLSPGVPPVAQAQEDLRGRAISILRESRRKDGPSHEEVVERLARCGPEVIDALLDILRERLLPPPTPEERLQTLSVPQREMILAALARWSARSILANVEARVDSDPSEASRIAALYVYASHGGGRHFSRLLELAGETAHDGARTQELTAGEAEALRCATARILARDTSALAALGPALAKATPDELRPLLFALGDSGDACAVPLLPGVLARHPELAPIVLSQARRVGASFDAAQNRDLAQAIRPYLQAEREELASAAARALGELGDATAAPELVLALSSGKTQLAESAHWALCRLSRLDFGQRSDGWNAWLASEREWWDGESPARVAELVRGSRATRMAAVTAVGARTWRRPEAADALLAVLWDNDALLRESACHALGQLAAPGAVPRLVETLSDPEPRVAAAARSALVAIVGTGLPEAPDECRKALHLAP